MFLQARKVENNIFNKGAKNFGIFIFSLLKKLKNSLNMKFFKGS